LDPLPWIYLWDLFGEAQVLLW